MQQVDGEVTEEGSKGKAGNLLGYWGYCAGVDGGCFGAVAVAAAVSVAATVAVTAKDGNPCSETQELLVTQVESH